MKSALSLAAVACLLLAGCSNKGEANVAGDVPEDISKKQIEELEQLATDPFPRKFAFPGQIARDAVSLFFNGTLAAGEGVGVELPDDDGAADAGGTLVTFDLSDRVPVGQPVELVLKLKWWGNPGASTDMDIYVNVPGTRDSYSPERFDESMNWNIVTKFRVVNAVRIEGQPFEAGIHATNGKNAHPDGIDYSLQVEVHYANNVFAPGVPYALEVPPNATLLIFDSESVTGDEHITTEYMVLDPNDRLVTYQNYNDIAVETRSVPVRMPGTYIIYGHHMHGGFLRVAADVPIPQNEARVLPLVATETVIAQDVLAAPGAQGAGGQAGSFQTEGVPLDVRGFIRPSQPFGASGNVVLNITSAEGTVHTVDATAHGDGEGGRVGLLKSEYTDRSRLAGGTYNYNLAANGGAGMTAGYTVLGYTR